MLQGCGSMESDSPPYGTGDASFRAAGGVDGIRDLVDAFYRIMDSRQDARRIRGMHPQDLEVSRDKLARFLCGWLGGPRRYAEKYGTLSIPRAHGHLPIGDADRDAWLLCMGRAIAAQPYPPGFGDYLLAQLGIPAQRIVLTCQEAS
jgi:hemoglobin